jgi:hypothetical protein
MNSHKNNKTPAFLLRILLWLPELLVFLTFWDLPYGEGEYGENGEIGVFK